MEEWHQKLHNNTSPDDVVICQALLAYIESGLDISAYWNTLQVCLYYPFYMSNIQWFGLAIKCQGLRKT